jgi:hypothetical protein
VTIVGHVSVLCANPVNEARVSFQGSFQSCVRRHLTLAHAVGLLAQPRHCGARPDVLSLQKRLLSEEWAVRRMPRGPFQRDPWGRGSPLPALPGAFKKHRGIGKPISLLMRPSMVLGIWPKRGQLSRVPQREHQARAWAACMHELPARARARLFSHSLLLHRVYVCRQQSDRRV